VLASGRAQDAASDALKLNADAAVLAGTLSAGETTRLTLAPGRGLYLVPASGTVTVNRTTVNARDGAAITGETEVVIAATSDAELVLVDVAA
jgi:redox-sensitive bicupin YhaK (pirin superfamily)